MQTYTICLKMDTVTVHNIPVINIDHHINRIDSYVNCYFIKHHLSTSIFSMQLFQIVKRFTRRIYVGILFRGMIDLFFEVFTLMAY